MKRIFFIISLFFLTACTANNADNIPFVGFTVAKVTEIKNEKTFTGFIDRKNDVTLSFSLGGILDGVYAHEGDFVKKGTLLAKLDNDEYNLSVKKAQGELDNEMVKYNRAKSYYERISKLHEAGGISYNDWEAAQTNLKSSKVQIDILTDALNIAKEKESFTTLKAPFDGKVIHVYIDNSQFVASGEKIILFQGTGGLEARVFVSQNDINLIKKGQNVSVTSSVFPNREFKGIIKSKLDSGINSGSYRVTVTIPQDDPLFLDGMSVDVHLKIGDAKRGVLIPVNSLLVENGVKFVYVLDSIEGDFATAIKTPVKEEGLYGNKVLITEGLEDGSFVVTMGADNIMDKSRVKITDEI